MQMRKTVVALCLSGLVAAVPTAQAAAGDSERAKKLVEVLQSNADFYSKARACQQAGEFGTAEAVPALAALLGDEKLSAYARSGLENIPDPSAAAALRAALGTLKGELRLRAGAINSLGALRDAQAEDALRKLAADPAQGATKEALLALGRIATAGSIETLRAALRSGAAASRPDAAAGCLLAAERQAELGHADVAKALYDDVRAADVPVAYRTGATRGAILARKSEGPAFLIEQLAAADPNVRKAARLAAQEFAAGEVAAALSAALEAATPEQQPRLQEAMLVLCFKPLFNGRTFDGWEGDTTNSFRIADGAVVGGSLKAPVPRNEFLATTRFFTNFILRAECKLLGSCNAGIQIRSKRIPNHHEVSGYQADMSVGKDGGYWGKLYDESRRGRMLGESENGPQMLERLKPDGWNQYEVRCKGGRIQLYLNGVRTINYTEKDAAVPLFGIIALQIHGGPPSEAWYRNVLIAELP